MDSIPTASVTGKQDWEWNQLQADRRARARSDSTRSTESNDAATHVAPRQPSVPDGVRDDPRKLVATLERKDRRLRAVITRYEQLLEERNRQLAEATATPDCTSRTGTLVQAVRRLVARW